MVLSGGLMAGVMYARQMSGAPNNRLKKYYEKCRNRNHKLTCLTFYDWQLSHLPFLAAFVFLQFLIITVALEQPSQGRLKQQQKHLRQLRFQNESLIQSPIGHIMPSNLLIITVSMLSLLNIWMLSLTKLTITTIDRISICRKQWKIHNRNIKKTTLSKFKQLIIEQRGKDRFTETTKHYELMLVDGQDKKFTISSSISKIVIKRHYVEFKTFMGEEVDVDGMDSVFRKGQAKKT